MSVISDLKSLPREVWILAAGTFVNRFGTFVMPFLTIYLARSGYSGAQAGIAVSAYGAGHLSASMLGGYLADRIGRRNTIALSMFASTVAMLALSQARTYPLILLLTVLAGAAAELYRPASSALIGDLVTPEQRVTAYALYRFAVNLGFAAGPATAGLLANYSFSYLFLGDAITSLGYGFIALMFLPHGVRGRNDEESDGGAVAHALGNKPFVLFLIATVCVMWVEFQIHSTLPLHLTALGFSPATYGLLLSLNGAMIVIFELALTNVTTRYRPHAMIALGYGLSVIGFALTGFAFTVPALAATVVIWTIGEMIYAPVTGAYVTTLAPEKYRGRYHGMWMQMWSVAMILGPAMGAWIYSRNPNALWIVCAALGVAGAALPLLTVSEARIPRRSRE